MSVRVCVRQSVYISTHPCVCLSVRVFLKSVSLCVFPSMPICVCPRHVISPKPSADTFLQFYISALQMVLLLKMQFIRFKCAFVKVP